MSTAVLTKSIAEVSPRTRARITGALYLIAGSLFVHGKPIINGDASATAHNILAHEASFRWAFTFDLMSAPFYIAVTALLYELFRPVNRNLSLLAAFFSLTGCTIQASATLFHFAPLILLGGGHDAPGLAIEQSQALALMFLNLHAQAFNICMVFFGLYCILLGYLIFQSMFLPRIIGVLLSFAGFCYLVDCFATFLAPAFAAHLFPYILIPGVAEIALALWLLVMGVNVRGWIPQVAA